MLGGFKATECFGEMGGVGMNFLRLWMQGMLHGSFLESGGRTVKF